MSTTIDTLPPLTEAMTARDLAAHMTALRALLGPKCDIFVHVHEARDGTCSLSLYADGIGKSLSHSIYGDGWVPVIRDAQQWIANHAITARNTLIRNMALAIISLTDEHGVCTASALERQGFARADIAEHQVAACARAGEMVAGAPFEVVS